MVARDSGAAATHPGRVVIAADGTCYIADAGNHVIRRIAPDGVVSTYAGTKGVTGFADGPTSQASRSAVAPGLGTKTASSTT